MHEGEAWLELCFLSRSFHLQQLPLGHPGGKCHQVACDNQDSMAFPCICILLTGVIFLMCGTHPLSLSYLADFT